MGLESTTEALEQSSSFPIAIDVDARPQLMPRATMQIPTAVPKEACGGGPSLCFSSHLPFFLVLATLRDIFGESVIVL